MIKKERFIKLLNYVGITNENMQVKIYKNYQRCYNKSYKISKFKDYLEYLNCEFETEKIVKYLIYPEYRFKIDIEISKIIDLNRKEYKNEIIL